MSEHRRTAVIMAGGAGERFWPLSRADRPKQLLYLTSETETMIEEAVNRILPLIPAENVFIATSEALAGPIRAAGLAIPPENVLAEPAKRNTAGCLVWVAASLSSRFAGEAISIAVLTADHSIGMPRRFRACVSKALHAAESGNALVTIGIPPTRPETGYGYIEVAAEADSEVIPVLNFREKPDAQTAKTYMESGHHYWNSGMFFWTVQDFAKEMETASPQHFTALQKITEALRANDHAKAGSSFHELPNISIDFALMEKAKNVMMAPSDFPWDDVGAWDSLERSRQADEHGNIVESAVIAIDSTDNILINDAGEEIAVGVVGCREMIVVVGRDAVLVAPKTRAQDVKKIVAEVKARGMKQA